MVQNAYHHLKTSKVTFCIPEDIQVTILHDKKEENLHIWEVFCFVSLFSNCCSFI